jgi:hypothetical protein
MNFKPELAEKVMAGEKTVTRRRMSDNPRSPWFKDHCSLVVGRSYAVCPGRGKDAIGRVKVTGVRAVALGGVGASEAILEGFPNRPAFVAKWVEINGVWDPAEIVWRVAFRAVDDNDEGT